MKYLFLPTQKSSLAKKKKKIDLNGKLIINFLLLIRAKCIFMQLPIYVFTTRQWKLHFLLTLTLCSKTSRL